jgi:hypothetical protein
VALPRSSCVAGCGPGQKAGKRVVAMSSSCAVSVQCPAGQGIHALSRCFLSQVLIACAFRGLRPRRGRGLCFGTVLLLVAHFYAVFVRHTAGRSLHALPGGCPRPMAHLLSFLDAGAQLAAGVGKLLALPAGLGPRIASRAAMLAVAEVLR